MFGHQVGVLSQPVARPFDLDHHGMVEQAVEQSGGDDGIAEDLAPFGKAAVGGEDHRAFLVARVDELEEQIAAAVSDRQVADLVDDEERRSAEPADAFAQLALALGLGEGTDDIGQGGEVDAAAGFDSLDAECHGEMGFAGAGRDRDIVPDIRGRTRRSTTPFILASVAESRSYGVIRSGVSPCWWSNSPTGRWCWCRSG